MLIIESGFVFEFFLLILLFCLQWHLRNKVNRIERYMKALKMYYDDTSESRSECEDEEN